MRILVLSDVHLDCVTLGKERYYDIWESVYGALSRESYEYMFFLGDWADPDNARSLRASATAVCCAQIAKVRSGNRSIWITGNHDHNEDGCDTNVLSPLDVSGLARVYSTPNHFDLYDHPIQVVVLPYASRACAYDPEQAIAEFSEQLQPPHRMKTVILGHLDIEGATPGSEITEMPRGKEVFWPTKAIAKYMPEAICLGGHIHSKGVYERDGVKIHVVGSLSRLTFSEENLEPGYHILEI